MDLRNSHRVRVSELSLETREIIEATNYAAMNKDLPASPTFSEKSKKKDQSNMANSKGLSLLTVSPKIHKVKK